MLRRIAEWLIGRRDKPKTKVNPFAIVVGEGDDPDLRILAGPRAVYPKKRGKAPEEFQADLAKFRAELRRKSEAGFRYSRRRAVAIGSRYYIWRTSRDSGVCDVCQSREGKKFSWHAEPTHGHAGATDCCPDGYCRCYPEAVFD